MKKRKLIVKESELIDSIEKIVKEQAAMLGFGNMGGLTLGVSKPTDKYEIDEDSQDTNTTTTYNVNYMDQQAANQNMEDWEMGEDYSIEKGSHEHPHDEELEEEGEFEANYFNSLQGIRTADVYKESKLEKLVRKNLKEAQKKQTRAWINEAEGKGCAESSGGSGCIKKRGSGWVILNNKKGGVWRKCDSKTHCEKILDAFHASKN